MNQIFFLQRFLSTTAFEPLARNILKAQPEDVLFSEDKQRANRLYKFEQVKRIASQKGPKFVYMHTLLPHDPYVFNESCQPVNVETGKGTDADYLQQLRCTNMFITDLVDHIQKASGGEAIIVLQSDEGPFMHKYYDLSKSPQWTKLSDEALTSHMRILNAYYLPGVDASEHFTSDATPVNTFRTIFNLYFNDDFPLLPNNSFLTPEQAESSKYVNITDRVRFNN